MNLNTLQKQALAKVMLEIIVADDQIDKEEIKYLEQIQNTVGISVEEIQESTDMEVLNCLSILKELDELDKYAIGVIMHEMVYADGSAHPAEEKVLKVICDGAEIELPATSEEE